jgi:hypothetical protein
VSRARILSDVNGLATPEQIAAAVAAAVPQRNWQLLKTTALTNQTGGEAYISDGVDLSPYRYLRVTAGGVGRVWLGSAGRLNLVPNYDPNEGVPFNWSYNNAQVASTNGSLTASQNDALVFPVATSTTHAFDVVLSDTNVPIPTTADWWSAGSVLGRGLWNDHATVTSLVLWSNNLFTNGTVRLYGSVT